MRTELIIIAVAAGAACARHPLPTLQPAPPPVNRASQEETDAFGIAMQAQEPAIKKCHVAAARQLPERVRLYISTGVDKSGKMTDVHIVSATVDAPRFFTCLTDIATQIILPGRDSDSGADYIVYPFSFMTE